MNNRKNSDLKKRLADLRINEPLRLSKPSQPSLANESASRNEVPHSEAPRIPEGQNEVTRKEVPPREVSSLEQTQTAPAHRESPQNKMGHLEPKTHEYPPSEGARSEPPQNEQTPVRRSQTQAAQNEQPRVEKAETKSPHTGAPQGEKPFDVVQGFFKLSHAIFSHPQLREMSGDCFRLFLWLSSRAWRYPDSDGTVRASVGYVESHVGMGHATISRGLRALKEAGLVSIEELNFKRGNLWRIVPLALGSFDPEFAPPRLKAPQHEVPQKHSGAASKRGGSSLRLSKKPPQNEQQLININKPKNSEEGALDPTQIEAALAEFENNVSEEMRKTFTQEFTNREYPHGIFPPTVVIKKLAAMEWYSQLHTASFARVG